VFLSLIVGSFVDCYLPIILIRWPSGTPAVVLVVRKLDSSLSLLSWRFVTLDRRLVALAT